MLDSIAEIINNNDDPLTYTNLIITMAKQEKCYTKAISICERLTVFNSNNTHYTNMNISEIDLWTLPRIINELEINIKFSELYRF